MDDLTQIELTELYDLLAQQTNRYMKMLSQGATKLEFDQCRDTMIAIQAEVKTRYNQKIANARTQNNDTNFGFNPTPSGS